MPLHPRAGLGGRSGSSAMRWFRWAESALRDAAGMHTVEALRGGGVRTMAYDQRYAQSEVRRGYMDTSSSTSPRPNLNANSYPGQDEVQLRRERHRFARLAQRQR